MLVIALVSALLGALMGYRLADRLSRRALRRMTVVGLGSLGVALAGFLEVASGRSLGVHPYALLPPVLLLLLIGIILVPLGIVGLVADRSKR